jgi:hypothetical protein
MHDLVACAKENNAYTNEKEKQSPSPRKLEQYSHDTNYDKHETERMGSPSVTKDR